MRKSNLIMNILRQPGGLRFYPKGDPFALAARLQDFVADLRSAHPAGRGTRQIIPFDCPPDCPASAHFMVRFLRRGRYELIADSEAFLYEAAEVLFQIVENHEALIHSCHACQHQVPWKGRL